MNSYFFKIYTRQYERTQAAYAKTPSFLLLQLSYHTRRRRARGLYKLQHVIKQRSLNGEFFFCHGMYNGERDGMEHGAASALRLCSAIEPVSENGVTEMGQLQPQLVGAAGFGTGLKQAATLIGCKDAKLRDSFLARSATAAAVTAVMAVNKSLEALFRKIRDTSHEGSIYFAHPVIFKLIVYAAVHLRRQGEKHHARGVKIKALVHAKIGWCFLLLFQVPLQPGKDIVVVVAHHALRGHARLFAVKNQPLVAVEYVCRVDLIIAVKTPGGRYRL